MRDVSAVQWFMKFYEDYFILPLLLLRCPEWISIHSHGLGSNRISLAHALV
jgi:hypothetical protein